jgi:hypothetical protein
MDRVQAELRPVERADALLVGQVHGERRATGEGKHYYDG